MTLVELLVCCVLMVLVLGAVVVAFEGASRAGSRITLDNQAVGTARLAVERMTAQLRNTAGSGTTPSLVERATAKDVVIQTIDPEGTTGGANAANVSRARFCVDASNPASAVIYHQTQTWSTAAAPAMPSTTACPGTGWTNSTQLSRDITNFDGGLDRPVWTYDATSLAAISRVTISLYVRATTGEGPEETHLETDVFLRNQNRVPTAAFTATPIGSQHVLLNASSSFDPDGQWLTYTWHSATGAEIGTGAILDHQVASAGQHAFSLTVHDTGGLDDTAAPQTITVP